MARNSSTYKQALALFLERFPLLGLLACTWKKKEISDEVIPPFSLGQAEVFYFYGLGTGQAYFQCKEWLHANRERVLVFLEDDSGIISSFLHTAQALEILADPQVHIELFSRKETDIQTLAERYPVQRVEIAGSSSKRQLKSIRLKLLRKTALSYAIQLDRLHGYQPFQNFIENLPELPRSFYANRLKGIFQGVPAIVCGAGPSLGATIDTLKEMEDKALLIAGGSTLAALSSQGVLPHFGMAVDPNLEEYRRLKNSFAFEVPLLYSTRVFPAIFQTSNGPFGYMRSGIGGVPELWLEELLGLLDPLIGETLAPESISVTSICIAWAQFLGCNPILLNGIDMAYTGNKRYASGVSEEEELAFLEIDEEKTAADRIVKRKDRNGKSVYTAVRWLMESSSISQFAKSHPEIQFINTTEGGIGFEGIDYQPLSQAVLPFSSCDIRNRVQAAIHGAPMPAHTQSLIEEKIAELRLSLERVIEHLQILSGEKKGSTHLAEMEIKEEIATLYLFYDCAQVLQSTGSQFWKKWLGLALRYHAVFMKFIAQRANTDS